MINRLQNLIISTYAVTKERIYSSVIAVGYYNIDNFGDQLTPDILAYYGIQAVHCPNFRFSTAVGVGSIIHLLPKYYHGYLLGSGLIKNKPVYLPKVKALLVRGHLTKKNLELPNTTPVGDPGLISNIIYKSSIALECSWDVGVIPHYRDQKNEHLKSLLTGNINLTVNVIDVRHPPEQVIREISKCKCIISSSLHGLIVADSLGIPNKWIKLSDSLIGGGFKFDDYYSCFGALKSPIKIGRHVKLENLINAVELVSSNKVDEIKGNIHLAYSDFAKVIIRNL